MGTSRIQTYHPGYQVDGAAGIVYNNLYHVLGFDKIAPLAQIIVSHRQHDSGTGGRSSEQRLRSRDAVAGR